jgi:radical SAM protein with 4Fe4S-binding SPASM domain
VKLTRWQRALRSALSPVHRKLETSVHPLRYLFLEITSRCNLACLHCGSDCGSDPAPDELSTAEWISLIEKLPQSFPDPRPFVVLTGGEPLCHPALPRLLEAIRGAGLRCGLVTNGWLLDEARVEALLERGVESVTVSLDGPADSHDWLRGRAGSFERALRGVRLLARSGIRVFDVVTCANPRNLAELPRVEEILKEAGALRWRLFSIFPKGRARSRPELVLSTAQLRELLGWIAERRRANEGAPFAIDFCCEGYLPPRLDRRVRDEPYFCRAGISIGSVLRDGAISACPNISRALVQGDVRTDDLRRVWDEGFAAFRDRAWMRKGPCAACAEWRRCLGNSMHLWDEELGHTCLCHLAAALER